jgi:CheY-like chemotaxis protein
MPEGGTLRIEVRRRWLDEEFRNARGWGEPGEYVVISVSDTGAGMDPETKRRIYEPFFTTKSHGAGTGLGMAMVMGLMKQHGGFIEVYSEQGQGTTVKTYFPATRDDNAQIPVPAQVQVPGGSETILVVEDQQVIRRSAVRVLARLGYQVLEASDGLEALEILSKNPGVQLVVSDIAMPRCSGPELYRKVRENGSNVPFLFMSGYAATDLRARDRLSADLFFIEKPWTVTDLAMLVRQVLDGAVKQEELQ